MEDKINLLENGIHPHFRNQIGRQPQLFGKWKTTSIFWKMKDEPNFFGKMEDDLNFKVNGRRPKFKQ